MELLTLARSRPGVSLVEPCMCDAIVFTCAHEFCARVGGGVPVGEVFDLSWAMAGTPDRPLPLMHSYEDFRGILARSDAPIVNVTDGKFADEPGRVPVIQFPLRCWIHKCVGAVAGLLGVDLQLDGPATGRLALHPEHYRTVGEVLAASNVTGPFSLVHWRGERPGIDFNKCAKKIVRAKERMADLGDLGDYSTRTTSSY